MKCPLRILIETDHEAGYHLKKYLPIIGSLPLHDWKPFPRLYHFGMRRLQSNTDSLATST